MLEDNEWIEGEFILKKYRNFFNTEDSAVIENRNKFLKKLIGVFVCSKNKQTIGRIVGVNLKSEMEDCCDSLNIKWINGSQNLSKGVFVDPYLHNFFFDGKFLRD